jgi:hypothetical protein
MATAALTSAAVWKMRPYMGLLLEGAEEPFGHTVGFRLVLEGMGERHVPASDLAGEVARDVLRPIIGAHDETACGLWLRFHQSEQ